MPISVGAARRDITPPVGTDLSGFIARLSPSEGVSDALHVRCLVVGDGEHLSALVQADLLGFSAWQVAAVRAYAEQELGIAAESVMLVASHTHSGPGVVPLRGCKMAPYSYQWEVIQLIQAAMSEARSRLAPATVEIGSVPYAMGINRREETPDGVVLGVAPEKPHPESLELARFRTAEQEVVLFSHACHPYVLGGESLLISGDFPSLACEELEKREGNFSFFLNGCAGNIAPATAFQGIKAARQEGHRLAKAIQDGLEGLTQRSAEAILSSSSRRVHLPYVPLPSEEEIDEIAGQHERVVRPEERAQDAVQQRISAAIQEWQTLMKRVTQLTWSLDPVFCEVQAMHLGAMTLLGISGEPFFEIGETVRAESSLPAVWPLGYANAYCGYIPTWTEYPRGGYEVDDSWKYLGLWKIDDTAEERVARAALAALETL